MLGLVWSRSIDSFEVLGVIDFAGAIGSEFASSLSYSFFVFSIISFFLSIGKIFFSSSKVISSTYGAPSSKSIALCSRIYPLSFMFSTGIYGFFFKVIMPNLAAGESLDTLLSRAVAGGDLPLGKLLTTCLITLGGSSDYYFFLMTIGLSPSVFLFPPRITVFG